MLENKKNSFKEDVNDLLEKVAKDFSIDESEEVKKVIIEELIGISNNTNSNVNHPFMKENYIYDALSLALQSGLGIAGKKCGLPFDVVFSELLDKINNCNEYDNKDVFFPNSAMFRLCQIATDIAVLKKDYGDRNKDFEDEYEEDNNNFTRVLEQ